MSDHLPPEMIHEVLLRLPAKSLLKCLTVCKPWYALISGASFVSSHCKNMMKKNSPLLLRTYTTNDMKENYSLHFDDDELRKISELEFPFKTKSGLFFRIVDCINGLYFLADDLFGHTNTMILWNPAIKKYVRVPEPSVGNAELGPHVVTLGYGFDAINDDYKIVRIAYPSGDSKNYVTPPAVEVYSLNRKCWRRIGGLGNACRSVDKIGWVVSFLEGAIHWMGDGSPPVIFCFDVTAETFRLIKLPEPVSRGNMSISGVLDFKGSLAVFQYSLLRTSVKVHVWVMKEYGIVSSWTKHCTIDLSRGIGKAKLLGFRNNGKAFFTEKRNGGIDYGILHLYNPKNKRTKDIDILGFAGSFHVGPYLDSIVLLNKAHDADSYSEAQMYGKRTNQSSESDLIDEIEGGDHPRTFAELWAKYTGGATL